MGWVPLQAQAVDVIKRAAIRRLQRSARGEALLLTAYLWGEEATEVQFMNEAVPPGSEPWLQAHVTRHLADEARHAALLRERLRAMGAEPKGVARVDPISAHKLRQLHQVAVRVTPLFSAGISVPVFAIARHMEGMAVRVLRRHQQVLLGWTGVEETTALLASILSDEERHEKACASVLDRLVQPGEHAALAALDADIARIERSWGITGAVGLWLAGWWLSSVRHEPAVTTGNAS